MKVSEDKKLNMSQKSINILHQVNFVIIKFK